MTTVTREQMAAKMLSLDTVYDRLRQTEPLESITITPTTPVHFELTDGWEAEVAALGPNDSTQAKIVVGDQDFHMTRDAALQACANVGLTGAYVRKTPGELVQAHLDYHYSHGVDGKEMNALIVKDNLAAFSSAKIKPFSNITLLDQALDVMTQRYGENADIRADYKFNNSLLDTNVRLVALEQGRTITGGGMSDIPSGADDVWYPGVTMHNSLAGKSMSAFDVFMFRLWCTNGAITTLDAVGAWNRHLNAQNEQEVYEWARSSVDEILGGMEQQFASIQALTQLHLGGSTAEVLREIFSEWGIPVSQRDAIRELLLGAESLNMYTLMNSITQVANEGDISDARRDRLMRIGGSLPTRHYNNLKARVWNEGHTSTEDVNPYELVIGQ
jgi:hypothetical protein